MKIHEIDNLNNSNIVRLADVLEKNSEILFQIRNKLFHVSKAGVDSFSVNIFDANDLGEVFDINNIDFGFVVNAGMVYSTSTIEAIVIAKFNF